MSTPSTDRPGSPGAQGTDKPRTTEGSAERTLAPQRVPTLTEVVQPLRTAAPPAKPPGVPPPTALLSEQELARRVMTGLQRQVDLMLEVRMREALSPLLARLTDSLVREMRAELTSTLQDVVAKAVAQEAAKWRSGR